MDGQQRTDSGETITQEVPARGVALLAVTSLCGSEHRALDRYETTSVTAVAE
jgi:hypothetical protein